VNNGPKVKWKTFLKNTLRPPPIYLHYSTKLALNFKLPDISMQNALEKWLSIYLNQKLLKKLSYCTNESLDKIE